MGKKALVIAILLQTVVFGNPQNPDVVSGMATFDTPDSQTLNVTASDLSIINWDGFSIDVGETTFFNLPSATSTVLNRVTSMDPSVIAGFLNSNGQVYLINQNGILVTDQGVINTAAFLASTLDVMDSEFLMGGDLTFIGTTQNGVVNAGQITGWNGDVILLGYTVDNQQLLEADNGVVAMGAGQQILLTPMASQRITIQLAMGTSPSGTGVGNQGVLKAIQEELKADGTLYSLAIQMDGVINATSSTMQEGRIYLVAPEGVTYVDGVLTATGFETNGGEIQVLGDTVVLTDGARIDASGDTGGGTILIGGSFQGSDPTIINSTLTYVDSSVNIAANAGTSGDGGEVVVWSNDQTYFLGSISATGGFFSGDGGLVEVSGLAFLEFSGTVDTSAPNGMTGTLLMDPTAITLNNTGPTTALFNVAPCGVDTYCGGSLSSAVILISDLTTQLMSTNVIIDSNQGTGTGAGTITVANPLTIAAGSNNLTFNSPGTITFNAGAVLTNNSASTITLNSATTNTLAANVVFDANVVNSSTGSINVNAGILSNGNISFAAGATLTNSGNGSINFQAGNVGNGTVGSITTTSTSNINNTGSTGTILLQAQFTAGSTALNIQGPITSNSSGNFQLIATSGNISIPTTANINFTTGANVTFQASGSGGAVTLSGSSMAFTGPGGSLTVSANGAINPTGPITYSFSGPAQFTATTGNIIGSNLANLTFNSGAGNVTFTTLAGVITTSAAASIIFNSGAGNLTMNSASNITMNGPITFNSGVGQAITMTAGGNMSLGSITYNSTGNASFTATGFLVTNSGTTLNWGPMAAAGNLTLSGSTITTSGAITMNADAGALSMTAVTNIAIDDPVTFNSPSNFTLLNTGLGTLSSASGGTITFGAGSGSLIATFANITGLSAINLSNNISYGSSNPLQLTATSGNISVGPLSSTAGAPVTIETTGTLGTITLGTESYSGGAGPLQVLGTGAITTGALTISYTSPTILTSSASSVTLNGASTISGTGGGLTVTAETAVVVEEPLTYTAASTTPVTFTSLTNSITIGAAISMNSPAPLSLTTSPNGLDITVTDLVTNASTAATATMTVSTGRDLFVGQEETIAAQIGSAGGDLFFTIGRDANIHATADSGDPGHVGQLLFVQIGYSSGNVTSNIHFNSIGRNLVVKGGVLANAYAVIGHGSMLSGSTGGTRTGNITFGSAMNPIGGNVTIFAMQTPLDLDAELGSNQNSFAQIGHLRSLTGTPVTASGNITLYTAGSISMQGANDLDCYALIGHGGGSSPQADSYSGNITIQAAGNIELQGGTTTEAFAIIGHTVFLNASGASTIQSDLVEVVSTGGHISITSGSGTEALIGLYFKSEAMGATGTITGITPMGVPQITVQSNQEITMVGASPFDGTFNGVFIGSLAYTGAVPFVAAGTDGSNLSITAGGGLTLQSATGGTGTDCYAAIQNGITLPMTGTCDITLTLGGGINIIAGNNLTRIYSLQSLNITAPGASQMISSTRARALIFSQTAQMLTLGNLTMQGPSSVFLSTISNGSGNLTLSSGLTNLFSNATITSPATLMLTATGDLFLGSGVTVHGNSYSINVSGSLTMQSGSNVTITTATTGNLTAVGNIYLLADPLGSASISASGALTVSSTAGSIFLVSASGMQNATISSLTGLTVTAFNHLGIFDSALITNSGSGTLSVTATNGIMILSNGNITGTGTGAVSATASSLEVFDTSTISAISTSVLNVNATNGDLILTSNSTISNSGTGGVDSTVAGVLYIQAGNTGGTAQIETGSGGGTISANAIELTGGNGGQTRIFATGGTLSVSAIEFMAITSGASIVMNVGAGVLDITVGADLLVSGQSSIHNLATGNLLVSVAGEASIINGSTVSSGGNFTFTAGRDINLISASSISGADNGTVSAAADFLSSNATVSSSGGNLSVTAGLNMTLLNDSNLTITAGSGTLTFTATSGNLILDNHSTIQNLGTGTLSATVGGNGLIRGGLLGDSFISTTTGLTLSFPGILDILAASGGQGYVLAGGTSSISASKVTISGLSSSIQALIETSTGNLTVSAGEVILQNFGTISILGGTGLLTVNATNNNMNIENGSVVQNLGSGALMCSVNRSLFVTGGTGGSASILGGTGGATVSAAVLMLSGNSSTNRGVISAAQGGLTVTTSAETILTPHATIELLGGSTSLSLTCGDDLFVGNDSLIQNGGTGLTVVSVTGVFNLFAGQGNAQLLGGTGTTTLTISDSLHLFSDMNGAASISTSGPLNISSMQDILLTGSTGMMVSSFIQSSGGALSVSSGQTMTLKDLSNISITGGTGLLTISTTGDLNVENGSYISGPSNMIVTVNAAALIRSGTLGNSYFSNAGTLTFQTTGALNLESISGTQASITSSGNTLITSGKLFLLGALITNSAGTLTVGTGYGNILDQSTISLGMMSTGLLTVNGNAGDIRIGNGSLIQNLGTGGFSATVAKTLFLEGGNLGQTEINAGSGGVNIQTGSLLLTGFEMGNGALLTGSQGAFIVNSTGLVSLNPFASISLTGGSGVFTFTAGSDLIIANASQISNAGSGNTTVNVTGVMTLLGGAGNSSLIGGTGPFSLTVGDNLHVISDANGVASITSTNNMTLSVGADATILGAPEAMLTGFIQSTSGSLSITASNNIVLSDFANILISSGSATLSLNTTNGDLYVQNGSTVQHQGTGPINASINKNTFVKGGFNGNSFLLTNGALSLTSSGDVSIEATSSGTGYLTSNGSSSLKAGRLLMIGYSNTKTAEILNTLGNLTVSAGNIDMINAASIQLTAGGGILQVNATAGNLLLGNGSFIQNTGFGNTQSSVSGSLIIEGGVLGASGIIGGNGGNTVSAGWILMNGISAVNNAVISTQQGALHVTTTKNLNLTPFSEIVLLGGSGNLTYTVGGNLYLSDNTTIHNFGSGTTIPMVTGTTYMCH